MNFSNILGFIVYEFIYLYIFYFCEACIVIFKCAILKSKQGMYYLENKRI